MDILYHLELFYNKMNADILKAEDPTHHMVSEGTIVRFYKELRLHIRKMMHSLDDAIQKNDIAKFTFNTIEFELNDMNEYDGITVL